MDDREDEPLPSAEEMTAALDRMPAWEVDGSPEDLTAPPEQEVPPPPVERPAAPVETPAPPPLMRILEALLFVGGPPLTAVRAADAIKGLSEDEFHKAVDVLARSYRAQGRPYQVQVQDHGYVLALRPRYQGVREKLQGSVREARLSQFAVDVLSLVAYRQPMTREEIDAMRGADSAAVLRQLIRHGLVAIHRIDGDPSPRYVTTTRFLELFGLTSLDDLPQTQDLQRL